MTCSICLENINNNSQGLTCCNHTFHKDCITPWINRHHTCPNCRAAGNLKHNLPIVYNPPKRQNYYDLYLQGHLEYKELLPQSLW